MTRGLKKTLLFKINPKSPDNVIITLAAAFLRKGALVAFPTETVYGLGASLADEKAFRRLHEVKRRPGNNPFTIHIAGTKIIRDMGCRIGRDAKTLIDALWPGPLTIVLKSKDGRKLGFRMPDNKIALELIKKARVPIVAPSANRSGLPPPRNAEDVMRGLKGKIDVVVDGGKTKIGVESTVIDLAETPPRILREGAIKASTIKRLLKIKALA
jgi:L-threonylcarbamoyladenylate synthase